MSFFEELTKKATGLLADVRQSTAGSAADIAGEAAMPDDYGKPIAPITVNAASSSLTLSGIWATKF